MEKKHFHIQDVLPRETQDQLRKLSKYHVGPVYKQTGSMKRYGLSLEGDAIVQSTFKNVVEAFLPTKTIGMSFGNDYLSSASNRLVNAKLDVGLLIWGSQQFMFDGVRVNPEDFIIMFQNEKFTFNDDITFIESLISETPYSILNSKGKGKVSE